MNTKYQGFFRLAAISSIAMSTCFTTFAQSSIILDYNNVSTPLSDDGTFFTNQQAATAGYEVPKGDGISAIYSMGFIYGGTDINGQLKMAIGSTGGDLFPGPATLGMAIGATPAQWTNSFAPVTRSEIELHIQNYAQAGYVTPPSILNWPAHGDAVNGFDYNLAPFVDVDTDGNYDPSNGDYPCIKGDKAVYIIMNDKTGVHNSGTDPIGLEVHYMFYQYSTMDAANNTTFIESKIINRGTQTLYNFKSAVFVDIDLGNPFDDYIGTDSLRNLVYGYNADANDEPTVGSAGYGVPVPAIGIITLEPVLESGGKVEGTPNSPAAYWNLMNAMTVFGVPWNSNYLFMGNPYLFTGETEYEQGLPPGDRRAISTIGHTLLAPEDEIVTTHAIIYAKGTSNLESVNQLYVVADEIQNFFDGISIACSGSLVGLTTNSELTATVSPNPSNGSFQVKFDHTLSNGKISLHDLSGRMIFTENVNGDEIKMNVVQPSGIYFLNLEENGKFSTLKLVIE